MASESRLDAFTATGVDVNAMRLCVLFLEGPLAPGGTYNILCYGIYNDGVECQCTVETRLDAATAMSHLCSLRTKAAKGITDDTHRACFRELGVFPVAAIACVDRGTGTHTTLDLQVKVGSVEVACKKFQVWIATCEPEHRAIDHEEAARALVASLLMCRREAKVKAEAERATTTTAVRTKRKYEPTVPVEVDHHSDEEDGDATESESESESESASEGKDEEESEDADCGGAAASSSAGRPHKRARRATAIPTTPERVMTMNTDSVADVVAYFKPKLACFNEEWMEKEAEAVCTALARDGAAVWKLWATPEDAAEANAYFRGQLLQATNGAIERKPGLQHQPETVCKTGDIPYPRRPFPDGLGQCAMPSVNHSYAIRALRVLEFINKVHIMRAGKFTKALYGGRTDVTKSTRRHMKAVAMFGCAVVRVKGQTPDRARSGYLRSGMQPNLARVAEGHTAVQLEGFVPMTRATVPQTFRFVPGSHLNQLDTTQVQSRDVQVLSIGPASLGHYIVSFVDVIAHTPRSTYRGANPLLRLNVPCLLGEPDALLPLQSRAAATILEGLKDGVAVSTLPNGPRVDSFPPTHWDSLREDVVKYANNLTDGVCVIREMIYRGGMRYRVPQVVYPSIVQQGGRREDLTRDEVRMFTRGRHLNKSKSK